MQIDVAPEKRETGNPTEQHRRTSVSEKAEMLDWWLAQADSAGYGM